MLSTHYLMAHHFLLILRIKVKLSTANPRIKCSIWKIIFRLYCHQTKQIRLSLASNLLNHQFKTSLQIWNPFEFWTGGGRFILFRTSCQETKWLVIKSYQFLRHLSNSGDIHVLLWVGVRRRPSSVMRRALTSSSQELLSKS